MKEFVSKRFWKALLLGGPMAAGMLVSLAVFVGMYGNSSRYELWQLGGSLAAFSLFLMGTLRGIGLWGRWRMLAFLALAPLIVIADFAINPFAPGGAVVLASGFLWCQNGKDRGGRTPDSSRWG